MTERASKEILALYGIPTTREALASSVDEALAAAEQIGYPVVLKVESPDLAHKSEAGAVALGIEDGHALRQAFGRVLANAGRSAPEADICGVLVQEMIQAGREVILGMSQDPQFGPVVACGLGGMFVEILDDVQLQLPPFSEGEARAALERLRGYPLLRGSRRTKSAASAASSGGYEPAIDRLVDTMLRFSELCLDLRDVAQEIDVNPLIVSEDGRSVRAVDCLIVPTSAPGGGFTAGDGKSQPGDGEA